jgi:hypothetical protein
MRTSQLGTMIAVWGLASPAVAAPHRPKPPGHPHAVSVPEIDASAGLLALAAVATVLLFAWERRRRTGA